ncbi:MAG TPA: PEP-CTERM sorting domain-containing protein [Candidatus Omnitrophota bacterium]|nr:PEP-CTERM sorting domain-containing protein [Candidatus Omnitrophota bacterium]HSA31367.1 PEP-CTERM sorting domain-containing protein [Candidatus Omnitrophota bacterium]
MKNFKLFVLILVALVFSVGQAQAVTILPDPTVPVNGIPVASYHDDFYSYSGKVLTELGFSGYDIATGTGGLDLLIYTGANGANNVDVGFGASTLDFPDPLEAPAGGPGTFSGTWGATGTYSPVTVDNVLAYLRTFDPNNSIPVFTFDMNETGASPDLFVTGHVQIVDPNNGNSVVKAWAFDNIDNDAFDPAAWVLAAGEVPLPAPYDDVDHNKGSGKLDFIALAPTMDLSLYEGQGYNFVATFNLSGIDNGFEELFLTGAFAPGRNVVPEPASMVLFGTGLVGFLGLRKKK